MTIDEALKCADMWAAGKKAHPGSRGLSVAAAVLAEEVRRLRAELDKVIKAVNPE